MKHLKLLFIAALAVLITGLAVGQKQNYPSKLKEGQSKLIDKRIDNMRYWKQLAEEGLVPVAQPIPLLPAKYTGSEIIAKSVKGAKDDSPDVPVTNLTNVSESENSVFVNPTDNEHIINSNNSTSWSGGSVGTLYGANYFLSEDGGLNWGGSHQGAGGGNSGDPTTAINLDGSRMYVNYISNSYGQGIAYSTNNGSSWSTATVAPNPGSIADKNHMWIDNSPTSSHEGNLYVAWTAFGGSFSDDIEFVRSTDEGLSWTTKINISSGVNAGSHNQGVHIQTGPNGEVYACWAIYDGFPSDETAIGFARSYDGGQTFETATRVIQNIRGVRTTEVGKTIRCNSFPVMAVDISGGQDNGNIYITWTNIGVPGVNTGSDADVYIIRSEDDGDTWSDPIRVNQDPSGLGKKHFFPWITCDPETGILSAIFYDDRDVGSSQLEVYCANSFDAAETWEDFKVSDVAFTPSPIPGLASNYMGDYLGITARGSMVYPVWTDNRDGLYMTYVSPFVTNNLPKPENLVIALDDLTGTIQLSWEFTGEDFLFFNVYRDGVVIGTTTDLTYVDALPDYGVYAYSVTAVHDDGESVGASGSIQWGNAHIAVDPLEFEEILAPGETTTKGMTIENVGELELSYSISTEVLSKKDPKNYCDASGGCDEFIGQVIFGDINNSSSCDGYADYTDQSTQLNMDETYDITVVNGNVWDSDDLGVWIDWNQDDDFEDAGENVVCEVDNGGQGTYSITVPTDALPGETRMRVRIKYSGSDCGDPCGTTSYGEVEDYTVSVQGWLFVDPKQGNIAPGDSELIAVTLDATNLEDGTYSANIHVENNDPDMAVVSVPVTLHVGFDVLQVFASADPEEICEGQSTQLTATAEGGTGTYTFLWEPATGLDDPTSATPVASPTESITYTVTVDDGLSTWDDEVTIQVSPLAVSPAAPVGEVEMCQDSPNSTYTTVDSAAFTSYNWYIEPEEAGVIAGNTNECSVDWSPDFNGTVTIVVNGVDDCGEGYPSEALEVTIHSIPEVTLSVVDSLCVYNETIELTGGVPAGGVYSGNGVTENGGVYFFNPGDAGLGNHTISYSYTDANGCENTGDATVYVGECLGVNEFGAEAGLQVYPNPNNGVFVVRFNLGTEDDVVIRVLNHLGAEVYKEELTSANNTGDKEIDISSFAQGIYFISVSSENESLLKKVVVRK